MEEKEIGTVISSLEGPSPTEVDFVVTQGKVHRGQFVEIPYADGKMMCLVENVIKTNKYFERADSVKEFESQGTKLFEQFPVHEWEYLLAKTKPLGLFVEGEKQIRRPSYPPSPGSKVFNARAENIVQFLGLDTEKGMHLGRLEFHPVEVKVNLSKLLQKHLAILAMSGSGKCAKYDTKVLLANGEQRTIGEMVDEVLSKNKKVENGIESWEEDLNLQTYAYHEGKIIPSQIRAFHRRKASTLISIKTRTGKKIEITPEHMIPVFRGKMEWIQAKDTTAEDYLLIPRVEWSGSKRIIELNEIISKQKNVEVENGYVQHCQSKYKLPIQWKVDPDLAELMAYWLAEGHNTGNGNISFTNQNKNIQTNYYRIIGRKFGVSPLKCKDRDQFYHNHAVMSRCLISIGFTKSSWTKFIPKEILQSNKDVLKAFLAAFIDCDGYVNPQKAEIEITLAGKELSAGIGEILTKLGIIYLSKVKQYKGKEYQRIFISGSSELRKLYDLNLRIDYKKEALDKWVNTRGNTNIDIIPNLHDHFSTLLKLLRMPQPQSESTGINNYLYRRDNPSRESLQTLIQLFEKRTIMVEDAIEEANQLHETVPKITENEALEIIANAFQGGMQFKQIAKGSGISSTTARRVIRGITNPSANVFQLANNVLMQQQNTNSGMTNMINFDGSTALAQIKHICEKLNYSTEELCKSVGHHKQYLYAHEQQSHGFVNSTVIAFANELQKYASEMQNNLIAARSRIALLKEVVDLPVFFDQIIEKSEIANDSEYVYDISVQHANFVANNIIIHNSYAVSCLLEELLARKKEHGRVGIVAFDVHGEYTNFAEPPSDAKYTDYSSRTRLIRARDLRIGVPKINTALFGSLMPNASPAQKRELGKIIEELQKKMKEGYGAYDLNDIRAALLQELNEKEGKNTTIQTLLGWMYELEELHLFGKADNPSLLDLVQPGILTVVDLNDVLSQKKKQVIVSYLADRLFTERRYKTIPPTIIVLEEAHNFIPQNTPKEGSMSKYVFRRIAREGRKFGVSLCLISQRPVQLDTTTLSQCNTQLLLRITNPYDIKHIGESSEGLSGESASMLNSLRVGEGVLVGEAVNAPVFFKVRERKSQPSKHEGTLEKAGVDFEDNAAKNRKETEELL